MMFCSSVLTARAAQQAISAVYAEQTALLDHYLFIIYSISRAENKSDVETLVRLNDE